MRGRRILKKGKGGDGKKTFELTKLHDAPHEEMNKHNETLRVEDLALQFAEHIEIVQNHDCTKCTVAKIIEFKALVNEIYGPGVFAKSVGEDISIVIAMLEANKKAYRNP